MRRKESGEQKGQGVRKEKVMAEKGGERKGKEGSGECGKRDKRERDTERKKGNEAGEHTERDEYPLQGYKKKGGTSPPFFFVLSTFSPLHIAIATRCSGHGADS